MSDINFSKLTWENLPARTTALSATNLNRIENGIADSVNGVNSNSHSIDELQTRISQMSGGVPPTASSTSGMNPEVSTVYINTTDGNWYYYNGTAWTSGGTYGGAVTDTTLSVSGAPADAKAVGDALDELETAIDDVESLAIPVAVKTAILTLFENVAFYKTDVSDEAAVVAAWAQEIESVTIDEATVSITRDGVKQLAAVTVPAGGSVIWESSNTNVATVSANGVVQGTGNGTCTITATSGSKTATCTVTVSGFTMYSVISLLTNCTSDNATTSVIEGSAYHATISTTQGRFDTLTCTMGGVSQTVTNGVIDIASVTGDIVITAVGAVSAYSATNIVLDGTEYVNTGIELFSAENLDRDFRLVVEIPTIGTMQVDPFGVVVGSMEETGVVGYPGFVIRNKRDQLMQMAGKNVFWEKPDTWAPYTLGIKRINGHFYYWYDDETSAVEATDTYIAHTALVNCPVVLGCQLSNRGTTASRYWAGTIDSIEIKWI